MDVLGYFLLFVFVYALWYFFKEGKVQAPKPPNEEVAKVHAAIAGFGTDEKSLLEIVTSRSREQLQILASQYKSTYGISLVDAIKSDTSGLYREMLVGMVLPSGEFLAKTIHDAISGFGTNEQTLIDVLAHATNTDVSAAKKAYLEMYKSDLSRKIEGDTSGNFRSVLLAILEGNRIEAASQIESDAEEMLKQLESEHVDDNFFIRFFAEKSPSHIEKISAFYYGKHGRTIAEDIKKKISGDFGNFLVAAATPRLDYWANRAREAVKGTGTDEQLLIRVFVLNSNVINDLTYSYERMFHRQLKEDLASDTSGWFRKTLVALIH